jgi:hypothetical protein
VNHAEAGQLLAVLAAYDRRTVGDIDVQVWGKALDDVRLIDAVDAAHRHYRASSEWLDAARVRALVKRLRAERLERFDETRLVPPAEIADDPRACIAWRRDLLRRVADGEEPPALEPGRPRDMRAIEGAFRRVPS